MVICLFCAQRQFERRIRRRTRRISRIVLLLSANYCLKLRNKKSIEGARRQSSGTSNQIDPSGPRSRTSQSERSIRTYFRTSQSERSVRTYFRTSQSERSIQIYFCSSQTDHLDRPTFRTSQSDRSYGPTFLTSQSYRPGGYQTIIHGHSLWSHPQDRTVRPSSSSRLRAKAVPCTHKPLTRKAVFNHTQ